MTIAVTTLTEEDHDTMRQIGCADARRRINRVAKSHDRISTFLYTQSLVVFHRQSCGTQEQLIID